MGITIIMCWYCGYSSDKEEDFVGDIHKRAKCNGRCKGWDK